MDHQSCVTFSYEIGMPVRVKQSRHVCTSFHGQTGIVVARSVTNTETRRINGDPTLLPLRDPYANYTVEFLNKSLPAKFLGLSESEIAPIVVAFG